jgi:hypothetical protein
MIVVLYVLYISFNTDCLHVLCCFSQYKVAKTVLCFILEKNMAKSNTFLRKSSSWVGWPKKVIASFYLLCMVLRISQLWKCLLASESYSNLLSAGGCTPERPPGIGQLRKVCLLHYSLWLVIWKRGLFCPASKVNLSHYTINSDRSSKKNLIGLLPGLGKVTSYIIAYVWSLGKASWDCCLASEKWPPTL